jgi:hypothetical protein
VRTSLSILLALLFLSCEKHNAVEPSPIQKTYRLDGVWESANYSSLITLFTMQTMPDGSTSGLGSVVAGTKMEASFTVKGIISGDSVALAFTSTYSFDSGRTLLFSGKFITESVITGSVNDPHIGGAYLNNPIVFSNQ